MIRINSSLYTLRTKLIIAFLFVSLVTVGVIGFIADRTVRTILTKDTGTELKTLANTQARIIGDHLAREIRGLQVLARDDALQNDLRAFSFFGYDTDDPVAIRMEIQKLDQQWRTADDSDLLLTLRLNNEAASALREFINSFPNHIELFLTDQHGALVAASRRTTDYYQADEAWWQLAFQNGHGATHIGSPEFDESTATYGLEIAVPVYTEETGEVTGILHTTYRVAALADLLAIVESEQVRLRTRAALLIGEQIMVSDGEQLEPVDPATLAQLRAFATSDYGEFEFEGVPSFVSQSPVIASIGDQTIADLGWLVATRTERKAALAPIEAQRRSIILLALSVLIVTVTVAVVAAQRIASPITRLTTVAQQVSGGDLTAQAQVESNDEVGILADAFNTMTSRLRENIGSLEEQVAAQTQQLEIVMEISQRLTGILDLSDLLHQIVTSTKEAFDYYHVHIYLLDKQHETLSMAEGYGEAGTEMKRRGHSIPLAASKSLAARAARQAKVITVENVRDDPTWLPNPLLPDTHAEMAVPVTLGTEVVGVLDVQSDKVGGLTDEDEAILQALASQIATAVRNARLFTETQNALYEAQRLQKIYTGQAWEIFINTQAKIDYEYCQSGLPPLQETAIPEAVAALQQGQTVDMRLPVVELGGQGDSGERTANENHNALATPLKLRDQIIGVLGIHNNDPDRQWSQDEIALIEAISEQMTLAIENARLFEDTQRNAWRNQVVSESTAKVWSSDEIEEVMQAAVAQLGDKLRASEVIIRLGTEHELAQE